MSDYKDSLFGDPPTCPSCDTPFGEHAGIIKTCMMLQEAKAKLHAATTALQVLKSKALACGNEMDAKFVAGLCEAELKGLK